MTRRQKRKGTRLAWYLYHRQLRIIRRECAKAYTDVLLHGTGFTMITSEPDYIRHVPIQDVRIYNV